MKTLYILLIVQHMKAQCAQAPHSAQSLILSGPLLLGFCPLITEPPHAAVTQPRLCWAMEILKKIRHNLFLYGPHIPLGVSLKGGAGSSNRRISDKLWKDRNWNRKCISLEVFGKDTWCLNCSRQAKGPWQTMKKCRDISDLSNGLKEHDLFQEWWSLRTSMIKWKGRLMPGYAEPHMHVKKCGLYIENRTCCLCIYILEATFQI